MRRPPTVLPAALVALALGTAPAGAQDPGVTIDPDAPATKEYEIPLESARRQAAGGEQRLGPQRQGERSAPLFGEGVGDGAATARGSGTGAAGSAAAGASGRSGGGAGRASERTEPTATEDPAAQARTGKRREVLRQSSPPGGGSDGGALIIGALAVAVLVLGGVLGSIARRRRTS